MLSDAEDDNYLSLPEASAIYRLAYGKKPENADELASLMCAKSDGEIWELILRCQHLNARFEKYYPGHKPLDGPPMSVEVDVGSKLLSEMIVRTEKIFTAHGEHEPHWTVLTDEKFKTKNIHQSEAAFFEFRKRSC